LVYYYLLLLLLALQPTIGFSVLGDFLPVRPCSAFSTLLFPSSGYLPQRLQSIYLFLGLPLILLPIGFHSNIFLGIFPPSIRVTRPSQAILLLFINLTMSALPMSSFSSWFVYYYHLLLLSDAVPTIV